MGDKKYILAKTFGNILLFISVVGGLLFIRLYIPYFIDLLRVKQNGYSFGMGVGVFILGFLAIVSLVSYFLGKFILRKAKPVDQVSSK